MVELLTYKKGIGLYWSVSFFFIFSFLFNKVIIVSYFNFTVCSGLRRELKIVI